MHLLYFPFNDKICTIVLSQDFLFKRKCPQPFCGTPTAVFGFDYTSHINTHFYHSHRLNSVYTK